jgi:hypothetical protein
MSVRLTAAALAVVTTFATALGLLMAAPALAQNGPGTPPYWPQSPFSVPSGTGASVPFTEYEAENASTNGKVIGPDFTQGDLATEASGRMAVQLTAQGQYAQFTLTSPASAVDVHYALSQGASGTLSIYVNGSKLSQELSLTSAYSDISTSNIMGSKTHKFYDDVRMMFGQTLAAGTTVRLQADSADTAVPYTIDVADFYNVPAAATQPANSISVTSQGADPTGVNDSATAFRNAISAANAAGESVWIPPGTYLVSSALQVSKATIAGAGDWYSQIKTNEFIDNTSAVSGPFTQTSTCGSSIPAGGTCTVSVKFAPTAGGAASGTLSVASSAPGSPLTVALSGTGTTSSTNLALNKPATASGYTQTYAPANAVDGNTSTYWESTDNAFPQWLQVDLGSATSAGRIVLDLPPSSSWATRSQTITVQGSTDGTTYTTLAPSQSYTFNPSTGNSVTITFTAASVRYVKLTFTANTGWPAGQLSELQVYSS